MSGGSSSSLPVAVSGRAAPKAGATLKSVTGPLILTGTSSEKKLVVADCVLIVIEMHERGNDGLAKSYGYDSPVGRDRPSAF